MKIRVYVAGKISGNSVFGTHDWRDSFCKKLEELSGMKITSIDPTKPEDEIDQSDSELVFSRNCFMISSADVVIVNLTDDISVGGSQEMLIAKYFGKPLIGIAPKGGKFNTDAKEIFGRIYRDYVDPFVWASCDFVAESVEEAAQCISKSLRTKPKDISMIGKLAEMYREKHFSKDEYLKALLNKSS